MLRQAVVFLLDKSIRWLANHGPAQSSAESLPGELKGMLTKWRDRCAASAEKAKTPETEVPAVSWLHRALSQVRQQYHRWRSLPRWFRVTLLSVTPCAIAYLVFSIFYTPPVKVNQEDTFRHIIGKPLVRITYVREWPSSDLVSRLLGFVLRQSMNNDVLYKPVSVDDPTLLWNMLETNQADLCASVWLPRTHQQQMELLLKENKVQDLGPFLTGARFGLAVPAYVKVAGIGDLKPADFGGIIYGIDPDSVLNRRIHQAQADYGLDGFKIVEQNDRLMIAAVEKALAEKRNVVFAAWTPHWLFGAHPLRFLDDPLGTFGPPEEIHAVVSTSFSESFPQTTACLARFKLPVEDVSRLLNESRFERIPGDAIKNWVQSHRDEVSQWIKPLLEE